MENKKTKATTKGLLDTARAAGKRWRADDARSGELEKAKKWLADYDAKKLTFDTKRPAFAHFVETCIDQKRPHGFTVDGFWRENFPEVFELDEGSELVPELVPDTDLVVAFVRGAIA